MYTYGSNYKTDRAEVQINKAISQSIEKAKTENIKDYLRAEE